MGVRVAKATSWPIYLRKKEPVPTVQKVGWAPGSVSTGAENLTPIGFDPRTVLLVASRYTDCAIPAHLSGISPL